MDHSISRKTTHSGPDNRAHYKVWCSCGNFTIATDSLTTVEKSVDVHLSAATLHEYSHSVDTCKACHERSLGF